MGTSWRDLTRDAVAVRAADSAKRSHGGSAKTSVSRVGFSPAVMVYLVRAAALRGISIAGYIRRSVMAHVAMDLGIDPIEIFEQDMAIGPTGKGGATRMQTRDLDGSIYGQWKVRPDDDSADDDHR